MLNSVYSIVEPGKGMNISNMSLHPKTWHLSRFDPLSVVGMKIRVNIIIFIDYAMKLSIEDFVYGATDGAVTTFAVVAGVIGASLSPSIILILGFANLFADGFSMSIGNYLGGKTHREYIQNQRGKEEWEIDNLTEQEEQEIRDIYKEKGFKEEILEEIVRIITSKRKVWVELGLIEDKNRSPRDTAITTFIAFNLIGMIPLVPFILLYISGFSSVSSTSTAFLYSIIFTAIAFFLIGIIRGMVVRKSLIRTGLNTLTIGGIAASVAYVVGYLLSEIIIDN
jgi:vacuolar iron transporter family protein